MLWGCLTHSLHDALPIFENYYVPKDEVSKFHLNVIKKSNFVKEDKTIISSIYIYVGSQIVAHTLIETGNGPNKPNTINL